MSDQYVGPGRRVSDTRLVRLEEVSLRLAGEVAGLRTALESVNDIQRRQLNVEEAAKESREMMEQGLLPKVERLDRVVVPRDEHTMREREHLWLTIGAIVVAIHVHEVVRDECGHGGTDQMMPHHNHVVHVACGVAFPESTGQDGFPSDNNIIGFGLYVALAVLGIRRYATARRRRREIGREHDD